MLFILDPYDIRNYPKEEMPKSCQFPSAIQHVTQLMNMDRLRQADLRSVSISSEAGKYENSSSFHHFNRSAGWKIFFGGGDKLK